MCQLNGIKTVSTDNSRMTQIKMKRKLLIGGKNVIRICMPFVVCMHRT